jgi:hypothetical protein
VTNDGKFLERLVRALDAAGMSFMVAGSVASNVYGHPRTTNDIDIVVSGSEIQIDQFLASLGDMYANVRSGRQAVDDGMFNVIDFDVGMKADLVLLKERPFSRIEFARRRETEIDGVKTFVVTAEDAILSKLEWSKIGESERQFRDAFNVASLMWDELDISYLKTWAVELKVEDLLERLLDEAKPPPSGGG